MASAILAVLSLIYVSLNIPTDHKSYLLFGFFSIELVWASIIFGVFAFQITCVYLFLDLFYFVVKQ